MSFHRLYLMSSHLIVRDHGSSDEGQEFQGTVAAEQAPVRTFTRKHILEQHITSYTAVLLLFFNILGATGSVCESQAVHVML